MNEYLFVKIIRTQCVVKLLEMSCYLSASGDFGPVQPQSEELCDHGETLRESSDRLVKRTPLIASSYLGEAPSLNLKCTFLQE